MHIIKTIFIAAVTLITFSSCEKVVEFDLNDHSPRLVIEGTVTNEAGPYYVIVSMSQSFDDITEYITVNDALVIITDDTGTVDTLTLILDGLYQTNILTGVEGRTYSLVVVVGDKTYRSVCTMPRHVNLDALFVAKDPTSNTGFALQPVYHDPVDETNFYRFNAYEGHDHIPLIRIRNDHSTNGTTVEQPVGFENYYNPGDSATLEMMCIDGQVYQYLFGLSETIKTGLNAPASPGNPVSNISGGCLGYFSAHTVQRKSILVE